MALNVNAAKLYNRILYTTDMKSYQKAKKDMLDLKKGFQGLKLTDSPMFGRQAVQDAKRAGKEQAKAYNQAVEAETKASVNRTRKITLPNKGRSSGNGMATSFIPAQESAAQLAARQAANLRQSQSIQEFLNGGGGVVDDKQAKLAAKTARIQEQAYLKEMSAIQRINLMTGLTNEQRDVAVAKTRNLLDLYSRQKVSLASVNGEMQLMLTEYRQINAEQNKLNSQVAKQAQLEARAAEKRRLAAVKEQHRLKKQREDEAYWNRRYGMGLVPGLAPLAFGAPGVAFAAAGAAIYGGVSAVQGSVQRNKELTQASRQSGLSTLEIQAISRAAIQNGLENFNVPKIADAVKDMNDKIGDFVNNATLNEKTGKWTGGGGLTDAANVLQLNMEQIKRFQGDPVGMVNLIVNRSKQLGISQAQMVNLLESFGNDFSRLSFLFTNDGAGVIEAMREIREGGYYLTDAQRDQIEQFRKMGVAVGYASESLSDRFTLGLAKAMGSGDDLAESMMRLTPLMEALGKAVGFILNTLLERFGKLSDVIGNVSEGNYWNAAKGAGNMLWEGTLPGWIQKTFFNDSDRITSPVLDGLTGESRNMWTSPLGYQNPNQTLQVMPAPVTVTVAPDSQGFDNMFKAYSAEAVGDQFRNVTLSMYGSTTNNNN